MVDVDGKKNVAPSLWLMLVVRKMSPYFA